MARPRKQTYSLETYLNYNREGDISNNADTQRKPAWKAIINGLIVTILTDDYIPPYLVKSFFLIFQGFFNYISQMNEPR